MKKHQHNEVVDEQGRKRLHGAFKGGFSAGYFNTVGSSEGWQPSDFISSRNQRSSIQKVSAPHYMDEEDLEEQFDAWEHTELPYSTTTSSLPKSQGDGGIGVGVLNEDVYNEDIEVYEKEEKIELHTLEDPLIQVKETTKSKNNKRKLTSDILEELHTQLQYQQPHDRTSNPIVVNTDFNTLSTSMDTTKSLKGKYSRFQLSKDIAQACLKKENPFAGTQKLRYKQYLQYHAGILPRLPTMTTEAEDLEDKYFAATATRQCTPSLLASKFTSSHYQSSEQEEDASLSRTQTTSGTRTSIPSTSHVVPSKRCITPFVPVGLLSKRFGLPMLPSSTQMKEKVKSKDVKPILDPLTLQNLVTSSLLNKAIHLVTSSTSISSFQPPKQMFLKNEDDEHLSSSMSSFPSSSSIVSTLNSPSIQQSAQVQEEGAPLSVTFSPTNTNSNEASSLNPSHLSPTSSSLILKRNTTYSLTDPTTPSLFDSLLSSATTTATTTSSSNSTTNSNSSFSSSSSSSVSTLPPRILFQKKKAQPLTDSPSLPSSTSSSSSSLTTPPMLPISHSTQAALRGRHKKSYVPRSFQFED